MCVKAGAVFDVAASFGGFINIFKVESGVHQGLVYRDNFLIDSTAGKIIRAGEGFDPT